MWRFEPTTNEDHYRRAFEMYFLPPPFLRSNCAWKEADESQFIEAMGDGINFAGFDNGNLVAFIQAEHKNEGVAEGHLFCLPKTDINFLSAMVSFAKVETRKKYSQIMTTVISRHKALHEVMRRAGFYYTGLNMWSGVYRNRLIESKIYIAG